MIVRVALEVGPRIRFCCVETSDQPSDSLTACLTNYRASWDLFECAGGMHEAGSFAWGLMYPVVY